MEQALKNPALKKVFPCAETVGLRWTMKTDFGACQEILWKTAAYSAPWGCGCANPHGFLWLLGPPWISLCFTEQLRTTLVAVGCPKGGLTLQNLVHRNSLKGLV